jgi:hypothetical protein
MYFIAGDASPDELYSTWWNQSLCWLTYLNVFLLIFTVLIPAAKSKTAKGPKGGFKLPSGMGQVFWTAVYNLRPLLATIYVIACGIRGVWPRMDELRICFYDSSISVVAIGRSLATIAELSFCAQICLAVLTVSGSYLVANTLLIANVIAQSCCWFSIITQDQRGHTVEESIWLLSGVIWTVSCFGVNENSGMLSSAAKQFRRGMLIAGPLYILFMGIIDVPMYYYRYQHDTAIGRQYKSFEVGVAETLTCSSVSQKDSLWVPEMPWMTLYFSFAVWTSIWLASADINTHNVTDHKSKKTK